MRISFVLPNATFAGGTRVAAIYADRLQRRGHTVLVVSVPKRMPNTLGKFKSVLRGRGWPQTPPAKGSHFDGLDIQHHTLDRWRPVRDSDVPDADVVVSTWWETAEWVAALSPEKGAKAAFIQGFDPVFYEDRPELARRAENTWRLPAYKIFVSRWLTELAQNRFNDQHVSCVPNSVDAGQFHALPRGRQVKPTVGLLFSTPACKGVDVALAAFQIAAQKIPALRLCVFGSERPNSRLSLPKGTLFTHQPPQARIREIYGMCDVWLCGSRCEGFHLPPLEAMACRCPVVSTRVGGPLDVVEDGVNGFLVDIENMEALAERLLRVLQLTDSEWRAMSDAAYATTRQYTWDDATGLFESSLGAGPATELSR